MVKAKQLHLASPTAKKGTMPSGPLRILEAPHSSTGDLFQACLSIDLKAVNFEWSPEREKALQDIQFALQAALPFEPHDPQSQWYLQAPVGKSQCSAFGFWSKAEYTERVYIYTYIYILIYQVL